MADSENQGTRLKGKPTVPISLPLPKRLRFRMAAASALGLAALIIIYAMLVTWAVGISTEAALRERQAVASQVAAAVDDLVDLALHQAAILAGQFAWNSDGAVSETESIALTNSVNLMGTLESAGVVNNDGRLVWSTGKPGDEPAWLTAPALAQALRLATPAVGAVPPSVNHGHIAMVALPLYDPGGAKAGALVGSVQLANTGMEMLSLPKQETGLRAEAIDREGRILASSSGNASRLEPEHLALLSDALEKGTAKAAIHEEEYWQGHVVAFAPFRDIPGGIVLEQSIDAALAVPRNLQRVGYVVGFATLFAFSLGVWWYIGRITRPFEELSVAARTMAQGSFDRPIPVNSENELGLLAWSLEEMRVGLKASWERRQHWLQELERRVEERTQEVHRLLGKVISAQEEERKRVARELHDGAAQYLATLLLSLDRIELSSPEVDLAGQGPWRRVQEEARGALAEVRRLIADLRPAALDDLGLVSAIRGYAENRLSSMGVSLQFEVSGQERHLSPFVETALFRIVQEALSNVVKHANARQVHLQLAFAEDSISAAVEDDGLGFDPEAGSRGFGLASMRERASLAGGFLCLTSTPGQGTRIKITIPVSGGTDD